jgi:glycosyltransferase involved in cell wall biosynthesis
LLGQTLTDFELIISDNASTDATGSICEEYAARDSRVVYIRRQKNIGAPRNWNAVFVAARGEFFKWAAGDDYCAPTLLERCVTALRETPDAVLCYGHTAFVDQNGQPAGAYDGDVPVIENKPSQRFLRVRDKWRLNNAQQGVFRSASLAKTRLDRLYPMGDLALMAELALYGKFLMLPEVLLYRRSGAASMSAMRTPEQVQRIYNPESKSPMKLIQARFAADHFVSVAVAPIPLPEKLRAWYGSARHTWWRKRQLLAEARSLLSRG